MLQSGLPSVWYSIYLKNQFTSVKMAKDSYIYWQAFNFTFRVLDSSNSIPKLIGKVPSITRPVSDFKVLPLSYGQHHLSVPPTTWLCLGRDHCLDNIIKSVVTVGRKLEPTAVCSSESSVWLTEPFFRTSFLCGSFGTISFSQQSHNSWAAKGLCH